MNTNTFSPAVKPLGTVKVGQPQKVEFVRPEGGKPIREVSPSCGCTTADFAPNSLVINAVFTPNPIPQQVREQGRTSYQSEKFLTVWYQDGSIENLKIEATVTE